MRTDAQPIAAGEDLALPWDLRDWTSGEALRRWIAEDIGTLDWNNPPVVEFLRQRPGFDPKACLCLLPYAYATAVFESDEIYRKCLADAEYKAIVGEGWRMEARGITRFRRENRGLLKWALVQLFKRALRARFGDFRLPTGLKRRLVNAAVTRLDLARQLDRGHDGL